MKFITVSDQPFRQLAYRTSGGRHGEKTVWLPFYRATVDKLPKGMPSIVITSDLQGREIDRQANRLVGEAVAEELASLVEQKEIPPISLIALAGDLYDYPEPGKRGGSGDVTSVWNAFASEFETVVGVHGNHDMVDESLLRENTHVLDGNVININGLSIGGVSGIIGNERKNQRKSEENFMRALSPVTKRKPDLMLMHTGPDDPLHEQRGDAIIREHIESNQNLLVAFGHCYWEKPFISIGSNQVLNADSKLYVITEHSEA